MKQLRSGSTGYTRVCICPPYRLDVGGLLRLGVNRQVVQVTNILVKEVRDFYSLSAVPGAQRAARTRGDAVVIKDDQLFLH